jgi:hypothetical protein
MQDQSLIDFLRNVYDLNVCARFHPIHSLIPICLLVMGGVKLCEGLPPVIEMGGYKTVHHIGTSFSLILSWHV